MDHLYEPDVVDLTNTPPAGADGAYRPTLVPHPPSGTVPLVDDPSAEVIRLQAEVAILQARLQASEELARERAERVADLRVILRMLPLSGEGSASAPTSRIWVPGRAGAEASAPVLRARPRADRADRMGTARDASHIWSGSGPTAQAGGPPVSPEPPRTNAPVTPLKPSHPIPDWREDFSDFPRKRGRHVRPGRWFGRRGRLRAGR